MRDKRKNPVSPIETLHKRKKRIRERCGHAVPQTMTSPSIEAGRVDKRSESLGQVMPAAGVEPRCRAPRPAHGRGAINPVRADGGDRVAFTHRPLRGTAAAA